MSAAIRKLLAKDSDRMFSCLLDKENLKYLTLGYRDFVLSDCARFIDDKKRDCIDFAIVDEKDEWHGTVSLKHIDETNKKAEYAIITGSSIHGTGLATKATKELIDNAFNVLGLSKLFLNVVSENRRAISFYKKCGFKLVGLSHRSVVLGKAFYDLEWYELLNENF